MLTIFQVAEKSKLFFEIFVIAISPVTLSEIITMKFSTKLIVAVLCIAIPSIAYNKAKSFLFPEGKGFDIWPEAQYRVEGTDFMEYQDLRFAVNSERFSK